MADPNVFHANKCIVIVRNPLDSLISLVHLLAMSNHSVKGPFDYEKLYPNFFDWWVKHICKVMN